MKRELFFVLVILTLNSSNSFGQEASIQPRSKNNFSAEFGFVDKTQFIDDIKRYKKKRQRRNKKTLILFGGQRDALSIFFDREKIDTFISRAKSLADTNYYGLRFYYAMYPRHKKSKYTNCDCIGGKDSIVDYGFRHTLYIVAMRKRCDSGICKLEIIEQPYRDRPGKRLLAIDANAENQGALCPPLPKSFCNKTEFFEIQ